MTYTPGVILVRHPCHRPTEPPSDPEHDARWICPGCGLTWSWMPPFHPIPRTKSYGFLGLKRRTVVDEPRPGRWTYDTSQAVYVPESTVK